MDLKTAIDQQKELFEHICLKHAVATLYAFGSSITARFDEDKSDVDLLVSIIVLDPVHRGETLLSLWDELENFFGRKVDLLTENSIRNQYLKSSIDREKVLIYDGQTEKVLI